jgi:hypothetical protein
LEARNSEVGATLVKEYKALKLCRVKKSFEQYGIYVQAFYFYKIQDNKMAVA